MAVTIRLTRAGNRHNAFFHIVATDSRHPRDGRFLERLGYYNPRKVPSEFVVNNARLEHWVSKGAKPSHTVSRLLARQKQADQAASDG